MATPAASQETRGYEIVLGLDCSRWGFSARCESCHNRGLFLKCSLKFTPSLNGVRLAYRLHGFFMIDVRYKERMGNRMFQYCLGRILAEDLGFALQAEALPGFPHTKKKVEGLSIQEPAQVLTGHKIDWAGIRADRSHRRIVLDGWFQRYEYYRPWRDKIRQWLAIDPAVRIPNIRPGLVIHVRRTDYIQFGWALPFSYYEEAIETLLPLDGEVWVTTDDNHDPFLRKFSKWSPKFFKGNPLETILFMSRSCNW